MKRLLTILSFLIAVKGVSQSHTINETYSNGQFGKKLTINSVVAKSPIEITTGGGTDTIGCSTCGSGGGFAGSALEQRVAVGRSSTSLTYSNFYYDTTKFWIGNIGNLSTAPTAIIDIYPTFPGTVSVTNGSATVTGTNTRFLSNFRAGDSIFLNAVQHRVVSSIASNTSLTLTANYTGSTNATAAYTNPQMERGVFRVHENGNVQQGNAPFIMGGNGNTALGYKVLNALTSGSNNVAIGNSAMLATNSGTTSVAVGYQALTAFTTGNQNTAVGYQALSTLTTSTNNTAIGYQALRLNSSGTQNVAVGTVAGGAINTGSFNVAVGSQALITNQSGAGNTAVGQEALKVATGTASTAVGFESLKANTSGVRNTAIGYQAANANITSHDVTAVGHHTLIVSTGAGNTAIGSQSGISVTTGANNTAVGYQSLFNSKVNSNIAALGQGALANDSIGGNNVGVGALAGANITGGTTALKYIDNSVFLGYATRSLADNETNTIVIGANTTGNGSNTTTIGNSSITDTYFGGTTKMHITLGTPPANATATGVAGTFIFGTDGYLYLCTATNTWVRIQLSTW